MKLLSRLGGSHRLAIHVVLLFACLAFLAPRADAQLLPLPGAQIVQVPDTHLRAAINKALGQSAVSPITTTQMAQLTSLDASGSLTKQIVSLTGLEHATKLTGLDLSANAITDVSPLRNLTQLRFLTLSDNSLTSIENLSGLTNLIRLNVSRNSLTAFTGIAAMTQLTHLDLSDNSLTALTGIEDMTQLTYLHLGDSSTTTIGYIRTDPAGITDFGPLRTLLGKDNVSLQTDILVVKSLAFAEEPATSYGAGDSVEIDVAFYNDDVEYRATSALLVDAPSGEKPYFRLNFGDNFYGSAQWTSAAVNTSTKITTVSFSYLVPQRQSANAIAIDSLKVPVNTRITYTYPLMQSFPLQLAMPSNTFVETVGYKGAVTLPTNLPTGKPISAAGPLFPTGTRAENMPESKLTTQDILTLDADDPDDPITYSIFGGADEDEFTIAGDKLRLKDHMLDFESPTDQVSKLTDAEGNPTSTNAAGNNQYVVVVQASDGGTPPETDLQRIIVTVTNVDPPAQPNAPSVSGNNSTPQELTVTWAAPTSTNAPITDYDVQYRIGNSGAFTDANYDGTTTSTTLTGLTPGTGYEVQVRATNVEGSSTWSTSGSGTTAANSAPSFGTTTATVAENHTGALIAHPIATDADTGDAVTYANPSGTDGNLFEISSNGQGGYELRFKNAPDYENPGDQAHTAPTPTDADNNNVYIFFVTATSGSGQRTASTTARFAVTVTDVSPPAQPAIPATTTNHGKPNELEVDWDAPTTSADAPITDYDVRYRIQNTLNWTDADYDGTDTETTLTGLMAGTVYNVAVLARNVEGDSAWSNSAAATTPANVAPSFTTNSALNDVAENETAIATIVATDADTGDSVTSYTLLSGADAEYFQINSGTGALTVSNAAGLDFENPVDKLVSAPDGNALKNNEYVIDIRATGGTGDRALPAERRFVFTVTDADEPPLAIGEEEDDLTASGVPDQPTHLTVSWTAPEVPNSIPAIEDYYVQYREVGGSWPVDEESDGENVEHTGTATTALITGLSVGGSYDIRVRSKNDEGVSAWRTITNAMTANNAAVMFTSSQTRFSVTENTPITTPVTTLTATDADEEDAITYALGDTPDKAAFEFDIDADAVTGVLRFKAVPDFENPADLAFEDLSDPSRNSPAGDNVYIVSVTATSGEGARLSTETLWLTITVVDVIEFDNTPPVVERLTLVPPPAAGYTLGSEILAEVTFDDDGVDIPANLSRENRPFITLYLGEETAANRRRAYWKGRRDGNSTIVTFAYEVQETDFATAITVDKELGITVPPDAPIRNSAGTEAVTTQVRDTGAPVGDQEQSRLEFPEVTPARRPGGGTQPGETPQPGPAPTLTQEVLVSGTPVFIPETVDGKFAASAVPRTPLIFNEFGNGADATNDWLELRNVTGAAVSLKDWELSVVQNGEKKDVSLIVFPDVSVPANGLLLITHSAPDKTPLAAGDDIAGSADGKNGGLTHLYLVNSELALPDDGKFLLILRNVKGKLGENEAFVDVAGGGGSDTDAFIREQEGKYDTHVWPLQVLDAPGGDTEDALSSGAVWQRAKADVVGYHKDAWTTAAFTGLGYDRQVTQSAATAGTPGYPNGAAKATVATPKGSVTISEIMVDTADGTLPQWIELYNKSKTEVLNLNRWKLELQNINSADLIGRPIVTLTLAEKLLQPNQTVLIVAGEARASSRAHLPADRIYNLFELHQKNLRVKTPRDTFLSAVGFYLKLTDREGELVDEVGNTDGNRRTDDAPAWALPVSEVEGARSSLIRRYDKDVALDGKHRPSWVSAANIKAIEGELYYGHAKDLGTPGWRAGGALPVELAGFSVSRTDAGAVVLTWATESEVDNAGFNLRRSERRDGSFTLVNSALIAGAGTTGERQTYAFTDTSAKPGVEYYYQLEEVSFAGKPQLLSMRFLRGPVSAANRQLRTFGEIKREK